MKRKEYKLHDGKKGTALAIRVIPRARNNEVVEIMSDGTIKIRLNASPDHAETNLVLIRYLSGLLNVPESKIEIVAGKNTRSKLISILDMDSATVQEFILKNLS